MEAPESLIGLVASARRRLWGSRLVGEFTVWLGVGASASAALWGLSRVLVLPWADQAASILWTATVIGAVGWWAAHRPTSAQAALWADQRLAGEDRLATAWELSANSGRGPAARRQVAEAGRWAEGAERARMGGEYPSTKVMALAATAVASAVALALAPSLTDQARAEQLAVRQAVDAEMEVVEALASEGPGELPERLGQLAESLESAQTLEEAISALSAARLDLKESLSPNRLAENTALEGLATRLSQNPVGRGDDPASQLSDLAASLAGLSSAERQAVAGELAERAADFAGINDELASALADAASALADAASALADDGFDLSRAADALGRSASEVSSARRRAAAAAATAAAAAALAESENRLRNAQGQGGQGPGRGDGPGQGQGSGSGGQGQGSGGGGQGQGAGAGGQGAGGGGQSARSGQGAGSLTGVGDDDPAVPPRYSSTVFEPPAGGLGEEVRVPIEGDGPGELAGSAVGPSVANQSLVPYTELLAEYRAAALASLERRPLPSHLTEVVQSYFTELEP